MQSGGRILILLLILVALPLRGYAAVSLPVCEMHHGGTPAIQTTVHDHSSDEAQVSHDHDSDGVSSASTCSACAGCCVGPSQAPSAARSAPFGPIGADRILFFGKQVPAHVADQLDRPPLVL